MAQWFSRISPVYTRRHYVWIIGLILVTGLMYQNCSNVDFTEVKLDGKLDDLGNGELTPDFVCSPFGSNDVPTARSGLKVELRYFDKNNPLDVDSRNKILAVNYFKDNDTRFVKAPEAIFLSDVNVPSRRFDTGFQNSKGSLLKDNQGSDLIEYFALKMESELKLAPNDLPGYYELATISDDGAVIQLMQNGVWSTVINNDGQHATRMGCTTQKVYLNAQSRIPLRIFYNQGPRLTIANVLLFNYRGDIPTTAASVPSDAAAHSYCGKESVNQFWDPEDSSRPKLWIQEVFNGGWQILKPDNFQLTDNQVNPCAATK